MPRPSRWLQQAIADTNRTSTLRDFKRRCHFGAEDLIGREMRVDFEARARDFAQGMAADGVPGRSVTNKLSELRHWRKLLVEWDTVHAAELNQARAVYGDGASADCADAHRDSRTPGPWRRRPG